MKPDCQDFIEKNFHKGPDGEPRVQHIFATLDEHIAGSGFCRISGEDVTLPDHVRPDILCCSPECPPFSAQRQTNGSTKKTSSAKLHPLFDCTMDLTLQLLKARKPRCAMIEQVTGWHHKPKLGEPSPMEMFICALRTEMPGYGVEVVELDQKPWLEGARPRHLHDFFKCERAVYVSATFSFASCVNL